MKSGHWAQNKSSSWLGSSWISISKWIFNHEHLHTKFSSQLIHACSHVLGLQTFMCNCIDSKQKWLQLASWSGSKLPRNVDAIYIIILVYEDICTETFPQWWLSATASSPEMKNDAEKIISATSFFISGELAVADSMHEQRAWRLEGCNTFIHSTFFTILMLFSEFH